MIARAIGCIALGALASLSCGTKTDSPCALPDTEGIRADDPYCRFYTGTARYRAEDYPGAASLWRGIIEQEPFPSERLDLKWSSYNNVAYLEFYGLGVPAQRERALSYWKLASGKGLAEPKFHLCSAYAEEGDPLFDPVEALAWCKAAEWAYADSTESKDASAASLPELVREKLSSLADGMTADQIAEAEERSRDYLVHGSRRRRPKPPPGEASERR